MSPESDRENPSTFRTGEQLQDNGEGRDEIRNLEFPWDTGRSRPPLKTASQSGQRRAEREERGRRDVRFSSNDTSRPRTPRERIYFFFLRARSVGALKSLTPNRPR